MIASHLTSGAEKPKTAIWSGSSNSSARLSRVAPAPRVVEYLWDGDTLVASVHDLFVANYGPINKTTFSGNQDGTVIRQEGVDHVLRRPGKAEQAELDVAMQEAADAVEMMLSDGIDATMARYNQR